MSDRGRTLMVQGTTSDAGKSTLVTALCRWLARRGVAVVPFKPQNMALNSAVTADGGEIGRAQAVQAQACRLAPHTDMNPVLLKPNTDIGAQVIIHGRAVTSMDAAAYHDYKRVAMEAVLASHGRLAAAYRVVMVEGAGSPAEINLRANDIANMGFAEAVDCPVILVADIDRGGVFAHLVGTLELLSDSERERVKGFVINRFRGDIALLQPGLDWLEARTGKPVLGVLPYVSDLHLEAEDAIDTRQAAKVGPRLKVVVPVLPRISNHTDFDPLRLHPQVELSFVGPGQALPSADLIVLPGSKSVRADLAALRERGWDEAILRHLRYGGRLLGICGGLQMLGERLHDPLGLEGAAGSSAGLGLLALETTLEADKQLRNVQGRLSLEDAPLSGYEIHAGVTRGEALARPAVVLDDGRADGARSVDGNVMGTYLHGLFESTAPVRRCCAGPACARSRRWTTRPCANATSSGSPTWSSATWIPGDCSPSAENPMRDLILGGARSGKSRLAERLAAESGLAVSYIATAQAGDGEMGRRIAEHRARRPAHWRTLEEPLALAATLRSEAEAGRCLLVDCLTLWLTNLLLCDDPQRLDGEREALLECLGELPGRIILVSNETGLGVVPLGELSRRYVDEAGWLHQAIAERCERVTFTVAGLPMPLKGEPL